MRLVEDSITTPLFVIIAVFAHVVCIIAKYKQWSISENIREAMPMIKKNVAVIREVLWTLGYNMVSGVISA